jgi:hypothetical protein
MPGSSRLRPVEDGPLSRVNLAAIVKAWVLVGGGVVDHHVVPIMSKTSRAVKMDTRFVFAMA